MATAGVTTSCISLWDRFTAWLGAGALAEQSAQNASLPQAFECQTFYCPNLGTTVTTESPQQGVCETQSQYTAINNDTVTQLQNGLEWLWKTLETYFILIVIILAIFLFMYIAIKET